MSSLTAPAFTTTFYVSNSGDDKNPGTSQAVPWKTAAKVNHFVFKPGDTILFQRGGNWHESLNPEGGDGALGSPITFADYGTGNKPAFWGSEKLDNTKFTHAGSTIWTYQSPGQVNAVYRDGVALVPANLDKQPLPTTPDSFLWGAGTLSVNVATNPNSDGKLYEAAYREDLICNGNPVTYKLFSHLVFTNLVVDESGKLNAGYGVRIQNGTDVTLNDIESYRCGKHNFGIINSTGVVLNNCRAEYPMPNQNQFGGYTAYVSYGESNGLAGGQTSVYNNCVGDHMEDTLLGVSKVGTGYEFFTTHGGGIGSVELNDCRALSSSGGGRGAHWTINNTDSIKEGHPAKIIIRGGVIENNQLRMQGTGLVVDGLRIIGEKGKVTDQPDFVIKMECNDSVVQNVLINVASIDAAAVSVIDDGGRDNMFRFNTILGPSGSSQLPAFGGVFSGPMYGNVLVNCRTALAGNAPPESYNLFFDSEERAHFKNAAAGDFRPAKGSPAINSVPASLAHPPTDASGVVRPNGQPTDAGAFLHFK